MLRYVLLLITKAKGILGEENTNEPQLSLHYCHGCIFQLKEISLRVGTKRHYTGPKKPLIRRVCLVKSVLSNYESASFQFKASESRFTGRASLPPLPPPLPPPIHPALLLSHFLLDVSLIVSLISILASD